MTPEEVLGRAFPYEEDPDGPVPCYSPGCNPDTTAPSPWSGLRPCSQVAAHHPRHGRDTGPAHLPLPSAHRAFSLPPPLPDGFPG